jgi:hypothetical protein
MPHVSSVFDGCDAERNVSLTIQREPDLADVRVVLLERPARGDSVAAGYGQLGLQEEEEEEEEEEER